MRKLTSLVLAASVLAAPMSQAIAAPRAKMPEITKQYPGESYTQYRRYYGGPRYYNGPRYYRRGGNGGAVAAGVLGLAAGALVAGAIANQAQAAPPPPPGTQDPQLAAYCARKYRSYDPVTGTFMANNGYRYVCTY
ncbi:BA14K family protein [Microvirga lotononidis]|nr:BA14K family protein [Microvirga lotononidis]WQO31486.1 BA14K family protein [Microvirga lotononidis]